MKLLFATANKNKLREAAEILGDMVQVISPSELNINADVEETGETLQDNSILKARTLYDLSGLDCFADDTGLEVEVLNGAPGVLTARYAACFPGGALPHDSEANMNRLLEELSEYSTPESRRARFRTVITLIYEGRQYCFEGIVSGTIAQGKAGNGGFGYDPIFIPDGFGGRTMAEISEDEKNAISHRGRALRAMAEFLSTVREDGVLSGLVFDQFIVKKTLLKIGVFHLDAHRITQFVYLAGPSAHKSVTSLIKFEKVRFDIPEGYHSFHFGRLYRSVHSPFGDSGYRSVKLLSHLIHHVLHQLVFDGCAFCISSHQFSFGSILALLLVNILFGTLRPTKVQGEQPVHHQVRISSYRRGEMGVKLECKSIVPDVVRTVAGFRHCPEGKILEGVMLRLAFGRIKQRAERFGCRPAA